MILAALFASTVRVAPAIDLTVAGAASTREALSEVARAFERRNPQIHLVLTFGASGTIEKQIENGAPIDVFVPAGDKESDDLVRAQLVVGKPVVIAANRLVLVVPKGSATLKWTDLSAAQVSRIAIANPKTVPAGRYAQQTLSHRGAWELSVPKLVYGENVRQVLAYVEQGNVDAGVVFATDAFEANGRVTVSDRDQANDHDPIRVLALAVKSTSHLSEASSFVSFLKGKEAQAIFRSHGFVKP